jgi:hypothetical protein
MREKDLLSVLKEQYHASFLKEADLKTETQTADNLINHIGQMLADHPEKEKFMVRLEEIKAKKAISTDQNTMRDVVTDLRALYPQVVLSRKTWADKNKRKYVQTFKGLADRGYSAEVKPKLSGIEKLAKKLAAGGNGPETTPIAAPVADAPKAVNLDALQQFLDSNKADLSEVGYKTASDAIAKAKQTNSEEDIAMAKSLVDQAANGDI